MNKIIDMHIHTNASDGTYTPQEVARETKKRGISIFSITDHDSIKSVSATAASASMLMVLRPGAGLRCGHGSHKYL